MNMRKSAIALMAALMAAGMSITAFAGISADGIKGEWKQDGNGWKWQNENGTWTENQWAWLDGNEDNVAECYYFDANGYLLTNTTAPDGSTVNADGVWTVDGNIQTKLIELQPAQDAETAQTDAPSINGLYYDTNWRTYYYMRTLEDGTLQVLQRNEDGTIGEVYITMAYQGNGEWNDDVTNQFSTRAWLTDEGVRISMGGQIQRNMVISN